MSRRGKRRTTKSLLSTGNCKCSQDAKLRDEMEKVQTKLDTVEMLPGEHRPRPGGESG